MNVQTGPPADLVPVLKAALAAWERKDYQQGIDLWERAHRMYPTAYPPLIDLGRAYGKRYDYPAAKRCFDKAIQLSGRRLEVLALVGVFCREFGHFEMALDYFSKAVKKNDAPVQAVAHLAEMLERQHDYAEATVMVERALKLDPRHPRAVLVLGKLERQAGRLENAEKILRSFLDVVHGEKEITPRIWYELGSILDRQQRYDEAMEVFLKAKAILKNAAAPDLEQLCQDQTQMRLVESTLLPDMIERWSRLSEQIKPFRRLTILTGHPRSGTTLLEQVLDAHPDVISADENRVFGEESVRPLVSRFPKGTSLVTILDSATVDDLKQSRANYFRYIESFMGEKIEGRMLVEKNPALGALPPAAMLMFPEASFLVAIRDPRDICLSCFMQPLLLNATSSAFLTLEGTMVQYAVTMNLWRVLLPRMRNRHLLVKYEDVVEDLESESRRTLNFLGIPWNDCVLRFNEHARTKMVRSPTYSDVAKPIFKTARGRWLNYQKYLEPHLLKLEPFLKWFGYE